MKIFEIGKECDILLGARDLNYGYPFGFLLAELEPLPIKEYGERIGRNIAQTRGITYNTETGEYEHVVTHYFQVILGDHLTNPDGNQRTVSKNVLTNDGSGIRIQSATEYGIINIGLDSFTVDAWIETKSPSGVQETIIAKNEQGSYGWDFNVNQSRLHFVVQHETTDAKAVGTVQYNDGKFHHVAGVYDIDTKRIKLYVDGIEETLSQNDQAVGAYRDDTGRRLTVGAFNWSMNFPINGKISWVRVSTGKRYTANFTPPEFYRLPELDDSTIVLYAVDEGTPAGGIIRDYSRNLNHGVSAGAINWAKEKDTSTTTQKKELQHILEILEKIEEIYIATDKGVYAGLKTTGHSSTITEFDQLTITAIRLTNEQAVYSAADIDKYFASFWEPNSGDTWENDLDEIFDTVVNEDTFSILDSQFNGSMVIKMETDYSVDSAVRYLGSDFTENTDGYIIQFEINIDDYILGSGNNEEIFSVKNIGASFNLIKAEIKNDATGNFQLEIDLGDDSGAAAATYGWTSLNLSGWRRIKIEAERASGVAASDGKYRIYLDDNEIHEETGIDFYDEQGTALNIGLGGINATTEGAIYFRNVKIAQTLTGGWDIEQENTYNLGSDVEEADLIWR